MLAALINVAMIGVSTLAPEYGDGLLQQVEDQRSADLAAYSRALVYNSTSSATSASSAAGNINCSTG
jgi:hypothetical protein